MAIEIVDLPIKNCPFSIAMLVYQRVIIYLLRTVPFISGITKKATAPELLQVSNELSGAKGQSDTFFLWERRPAFHQWIGLREKLQETPKFDGKNHGFL